MVKDGSQGWRGDQRETTSPQVSKQKARRKGQLPPSVQERTAAQAITLSHSGPWPPGPLAHPLQPQELTFGCPSRRSLWNTWQNFQQSTALLERGSRLTTDQKVCAPFSWWVPSMHGEEGHGKQSTGPASGSQPIFGVEPAKGYCRGCTLVQGTVALPRRGHSLQRTHRSPVQFFDRCQ